MTVPVYKLAKPGWFSEVNGIKVVAAPLPDHDGDFNLSEAGSFVAHHGIELHRQQGPGGDIRGTQIERGYPIATWNIGPDGVIRQYCDMFAFAPWHGDSVSQYAFGIEVAGDTGTPETAAQLRSEEALCAGIIDYTEDRTGEIIPVKFISRISLANYRTAKGEWPHRAVDFGPLNENGHTDFMEGESPSAFAKNVKAILSASQKPVPPFPGILKLGTDSAGVIRWKRRMASKELFTLKDANDGPHFGAVIESATKTFQARRKLDVDGIVGPKTWAAAWGG